MGLIDPTKTPPAAVAYVDGACEPVNPGGTGGWGYSIRDISGRLLQEGYGRLAAGPEMTINVAEYVSAGMAVKTFMELGLAGPLLVRSDSKLVVMQMQGAWQVRRGAYVRVHHRLCALLDACSFDVGWEWVPRERNTRAVELSTKALAEIGITPTARR